MPSPGKVIGHFHDRRELGRGILKLSPGFVFVESILGEIQVGVYLDSLSKNNGSLLYQKVTLSVTA
jgi:hypothetical protein